MSGRASGKSSSRTAGSEHVVPWDWRTGLGFGLYPEHDKKPLAGFKQDANIKKIYIYIKRDGGDGEGGGRGSGEGERRQQEGREREGLSLRSSLQRASFCLFPGLLQLWLFLDISCSLGRTFLGFDSFVAGRRWGGPGLGLVWPV